MSAPVLQVDGLTVAYRHDGLVTPVVSDLSFSIAAGETVALVGESGSGKSTTAGAVLGLLPPAALVRARAVLLDGQPILGLDEPSLRRLRGTAIAYVPQDPGASLDPVRRIGDQVAEVFAVHGIGRRGERRGLVEHALGNAGIPQPQRRLRQYPHELSGGLQQRVLIAIASAASPRLIVADEPTSALDVTVQRDVLDNLQRLSDERGTAMLLVTHDLGVAADRADRILVLRGGKIVEEGPTRAVLASPAAGYTRELVASLPSIAIAGVTSAASPPTPPEHEPLLTATGLVKRFGRGRASVAAVDDVSVLIGRGDAVGLVGESGSGKTTTGRILAGLESADAGSVLLDGDDITALRGAARRTLRRRIQVVHQNPARAINPAFTVAAAIAEPLRAFGVARSEREARVAALLDRVRLPAAFVDRRAGTLSGGQAQRVAIARALALSPDLVVLDEPVSALDVSVQAQIIDLLAELRRELSLSFLLISHDLAVVATLADTVAVMQHGRIVESGPTAQVFGDPSNEYTRRLLEAIPGRGLATTP